MASPVQRMPRAPHDAAVARRDRGLRRLRRATAVVGVTAALSVGGVSALAAATRPGHPSPTGAAPRAGEDDSSSGTLQAPAAPPTAQPASSSGDDGASHSSGDDGQSTQAAPSASAPQPQPQPAPAPPPVTSGGS